MKTFTDQETETKLAADAYYSSIAKVPDTFPR